ncbi:MAG: DUF4097 family beta strand repeat-containing protein [Candidatus Acidiferrales bacterium]|jgi:DUF4097 and DUF4098 domain-containing protein YvlB
MSDQPRSRHSIFGGLVLVLIGALFLIHNFHPQFELWDLLWRWWPLLLILLGVARLIDYAIAQHSDKPAPRIVSGGDIFLILVLLAVIAGVAGVYHVRSRMGDADFYPSNWGNPYVFSEQVPAQAVPADARIQISDLRGDISVHAEAVAQILVTAKKTVSEFSQSDAQKRADAVHFVVIDNHDGSFQVEPQEQGMDSRHVQVDLDVQVPQKASVTASTQRGDVDIAGLAGTIESTTHNGDIDVRDAGGDVTATTDHGDVRINGVAGNVRLTGKGNEVTIESVKGEADVEGEFYGPYRFSQVAKGARISSKRTDLTVTALPGTLQLDAGNLEIQNSPGDVTVTTAKNDVRIEDISGTIHVDNQDGDIEVRFSQQPRQPLNITDGSGDVSITLPAKANFQLDAESESGDVNSEFEGIATRKDGDRSILSGQAGTRGPLIHIFTTYGDIHIRKGT